MVLDHLIVQKMDKEQSTGEDLQSILTYGAKALFDDQGDQGITCTCIFIRDRSIREPSP